MSGRDVARMVGAGRIAAGATLVIAPRLVTRAWLGADGDTAGAAVLARAMGIRDAVIGAIALHTLDNPQVGPRWQRTAALIDGVDLAATLAARRQVPATGVALAAVVASGAIVAELWAAGRLKAIAEPPAV